jgi:hypothetical protein
MHKGIAKMGEAVGRKEAHPQKNRKPDYGHPSQANH